MQRLIVDDNDDVYVMANTFSEEISHGTRDGLIMKVTKSGSSIWSKFFGAEDEEFFVKMAVRSDQLLISGKTNSPSMSSGDFDILALKLNATDGSKMWVKTFGGSGTEDQRSLVADDYYMYLGCWTNTPSYSNGDKDWLMMKLKISDGAMMWSKYYGTTNED